MRWLKYLWIPFSIIFAAIFVHVFRKSYVHIPDPITEIEAISAEAKYKALAKQVGAQRALNAIEATYRKEMSRLAVAQKVEAERLKKDPAKLAAFLIRAAR